MSNVLVTYTSGTGCTKGVAEKIGETLSAEGIQVDVQPMDGNPDIGAFDAVVAGSGVRASQWDPHAKKWADHNADALKAKPVAFFTVGIALAADPTKTDEARACTDKLIEKTGIRPMDIGTFAGWYVPSEFTFVERKIMEFTKAPEGDHRDWDAIETWARSVSDKLRAEA